MKISMPNTYFDQICFQLKWSDAYGGQGEHYYDYNHGPADYKAAGLHSEQQEQYIEAPAESRY